MMLGMGEAVKKQKVIYYSDELKDEFSTAKIKPVTIDKDYSYDGNGLRKFSHIFWYVILARPLAYIFLKLKFGHKIVNRNVLKQSAGRSIFIYGNHTNAVADAFSSAPCPQFTEAGHIPGFRFIFGHWMFPCLSFKNSLL